MIRSNLNILLDCLDWHIQKSALFTTLNKLPTPVATCKRNESVTTKDIFKMLLYFTWMEKETVASVQELLAHVCFVGNSTYIETVEPSNNAQYKL